ncbi:uncharacterized protein BDZ99DRAFT_469437 [Mytilinidion resinicola]|uniref:Uncharacterized protein n=1 Tax=Mytilinidion resinicola TaxID=574789 RepID=A0A6A6XZ65_9PEZI|nr:uncharacterized protein BDZ99DRAFT_469437 [Mytilinidion resinicola]KAF2801700.1 hypothetical protein BDZ99DRAFT_469437 [Mytilinidion resinicola]
MADATAEPEYHLFPVFCTAEIPVEMINEFLSADPMQEAPLWTLVRSPEQESFDIPTLPPIEAFTSGFLGASFEDLVSYDKAHFLPGYDAQIDVNCFVVMDARTLKDQTVAFHVLEYWPRRYEEEDPDAYEGSDGDDEVEGWKSVRFRIRSASALIYWVSEYGLWILEQDETLVPENGIMKDSDMFKDEEQLREV